MELRRIDVVPLTILAVLYLTAVGLTGCYSSITAKEVTEDPNASGLRYFLPTPYLIIRHLPNDTWDAELQVFVDRSRTFSVQPNAYFAKSDFKLVNNADGTIKSFKLGHDTTVVASASVNAAKDVALKEMELRQQTLDRQIQASQKSSSEASMPKPAVSAGTAAGAPTTAKPSAATTTAKPSAATTSKNVGEASGAGGASTNLTKAGDSSKEPENATSHLMLDTSKREVYIYRILGSRLEPAGPVAAVSVPVGVKQPVAAVRAPIAVNKYVPKSGQDGTAATGKMVGDINWFGPINVKPKDNEFLINSSEAWDDSDKKFFQFFTDNEGSAYLGAEQTVQLREKFTFKRETSLFSVKQADLKDAHVMSVRFNKPK
jgi:hypothetical protein